MNVVWRHQTLRCFVHVVYLRVLLRQTSLDACSISACAVYELRVLETDTATSIEGWAMINLNYVHCSSIQMIHETFITWVLVVGPARQLGVDYGQTNCTIN